MSPGVRAGLRAAAQTAVAALLVVLLLVVLMEALGDPVAVLLPSDAPPEQVAALRARLGLDRPFAARLVDRVGHAIVGDFGRSYAIGEPAGRLVVDRLPNTLALVGASAVLGVAGGLALGAADGAVLRRHVAPHLLRPLWAVALIDFAIAVSLVATLAFLGLGVRPPAPSWGGMVAEGRRYFPEAWWILAFPSAALATTLLAAASLGPGRARESFAELTRPIAARRMMRSCIIFCRWAYAGAARVALPVGRTGCRRRTGRSGETF
jgi:ABC-type dipeptide/oligopeptide/nickel transport system permease component